MTHKYIGLDAIRGLAALMVLAHHTPPFWLYWPPRAYLAVDVFFLLSGFVIAHSYEAKIASGQLSPGRFVALRLVRLYPLYALSLALSLGSLALKMQWPSSSSAAHLAEQTVRGIFMVPSLDSPSMFPRNTVFWSLYFEFVVNLAFIIVRPVLGERVLRGIVAASAVALVGLAAFNGDNTLGGQGTPLDWLGGLVRATFGIFTGLWLYRHRTALWAQVPRRLTLAPAIACLLAILASSHVGRFDWIIDAVAATVLFPFCVVCATRAEPVRGHRWMTALGVASYPLYLLHPIAGGVAMKAAPQWIAAHPGAAGWMFAATMVLVSLAVDALFDLPVRRWLGRTLLARPPVLSPMP